MRPASANDLAVTGLAILLGLVIAMGVLVVGLAVVTGAA